MSFNLSGFLRTLLAKWKLIAVIVLLAVAGTAAYTHFFVTPMYRSSATIYVCPSTNTRVLSDITTARSYVDTYRALIDSDNVIGAVFTSLYETGRTGENAMNHVYSISELRSMKSVSSVNETEVVSISITCADPHDAQLIADQFVASAEPVITSAIRAEAYTIVDNANLPRSPCSPNITKNVLIALAASLAFSCAVIFFMEYLDRRVKDTQTLSELISAPIVGVIPEFD